LNNGSSACTCPGSPREQKPLIIFNQLNSCRERPLICVIDDEQWLDRASVQALGFAARRLGADPAGLVFAAREPGAELAGLPELDVGRLPATEAGLVEFGTWVRFRLPRPHLHTKGNQR